MLCTTSTAQVSLRARRNGTGIALNSLAPGQEKASSGETGSKRSTRPQPEQAAIALGLVKDRQENRQTNTPRLLAGDVEGKQLEKETQTLPPVSSVGPSSEGSNRVAELRKTPVSWQKWPENCYFREGQGKKPGPFSVDTTELQALLSSLLARFPANFHKTTQFPHLMRGSDVTFERSLG